MTQKLAELLRETELLSPDERLLLVAHLTGQSHVPTPSRSWRDVSGLAVAPLAGEDAQAWVSRSRAEDERKRERA